MGVLRISHDLYGTEIMDLCLKFLKQEHKATIEEPKTFLHFMEYRIEGEDIPEGHSVFSVDIEAVGEGVIAFKIDEYV